MRTQTQMHGVRIYCVLKKDDEHNVLCEAKQSHTKREINLHFSDV